MVPNECCDIFADIDGICCSYVDQTILNKPKTLILFFTDGKSAQSAGAVEYSCVFTEE